MAVTQAVNDVIKMTAQGDEVTGRKFVRRITWSPGAASKTLVVTNSAGVEYCGGISTTSQLLFQFEIGLPMDGVKIGTLTATGGTVWIQVT